MSYLSFSNSMNKVNERCPLNCTPASALLVQSASDNLQQCMKQAPFSPLPSSLTLLCARSPSLPPLWHTHTKVSRITLAPQALPFRMGSALRQAKAGLCAWTRVCPKESCCCCTKHNQNERIVINSPNSFFL